MVTAALPIQKKKDGKREKKVDLKIFFYSFPLFIWFVQVLYGYI